MRLLVISHTEHYRSSGAFAGWGVTIRELDYLARLFHSIRHIACLHDGPAPASALPYSEQNITLAPVPPSGGESLRGKLGILKCLPLYARTILRELPNADVVHVRCPANISMLAIVLLAFVKHPRIRWVKYAGNWRPDGREAWSYTFQRWWLNKGLHRGIVTVNGRWPGQPPHVHSFLNPCLTQAEVEAAKELALRKELSRPVRLLFVGRLEEAKGVGRALRVLHKLVMRGCDAVLDLVGDGSERTIFERLADELGIRERVNFHGWLPRTALGPLYALAHILVFPSSSEGWPKVLSEGMAYGVVPVAGAISSIPQILAQTGAGIAVPPHDVEKITDSVEALASNADEWKRLSEKGVEASPLFTYEAYLRRVAEVLGIEPPSEFASAGGLGESRWQPLEY